VKGTRVFAYLKSFPGLTGLLSALAATALPTIAVIQQAESEAVYEYADHPTLRITRRHVAIERAMSECDLAILNAGHGATATCLRAGKPALLIPIFTEQFLLACRVAEIGAGVIAPPSDARIIVERLQELLSSGSYRANAGQFAQRYANESSQERIAAVVARIEELASSGDQ
jgi:UDP:flavonoid glycosyltransferase YjiC (YdhE family)